MARILFDDYIATRDIVGAMWNEVFGIEITDWKKFASGENTYGNRSDNKHTNATTQTVPSEVFIFPNESTDAKINPLNKSLRFNEINNAEEGGKVTPDAINALYNLVQVAEEEAYKGAGYGADKGSHWATYNSSKNVTVKTSQYSGYDSYNSGYHSGWCTGRNSGKNGTVW